MTDKLTDHARRRADLLAELAIIRRLERTFLERLAALDAERDPYVLQAYADGKSLRAIARAVGMSHEGIRSLLARLRR